MDKHWLQAQEQYLDPDRYTGWETDEGDLPEPPICEQCFAQGDEEHLTGCDFHWHTALDRDMKRIFGS